MLRAAEEQIDLDSVHAVWYTAAQDSLMPTLKLAIASPGNLFNRSAEPSCGIRRTRLAASACPPRLPR
jgi:hypothetical protein